jgi:signal peptidase II
MIFLNKRIFPAIIGIVVFLADFASKYLTQKYLPVMNRQSLWYPYNGIGIFENFLGIEFSISHQINRGAAWGVLSDYQLPLLYFRIALVACLLFYALFANKQKSWSIPLALVISGAAGNILDYFLYGHVVDMFHFVLWGYDFPVFNVADSAIFIGIAWLIFASSFEKQSKPGRAR